MKVGIRTKHERYKGVFMRKPNRNRPNALKHGAFAKTAVLPWEDPEQFEELHSSLIEEWAPVGPTEQDAVFSIAMGMWRKRRLARFINTARQRCELDPNHAAYNETYALRVFSGLIAFAPDQFENYLTALTLMLPRGCDKIFGERIFNPLRNGFTQS